MPEQSRDLSRRDMQYRSEVVSVAGFVQQIACSYLRHGYWWYVTGRIPGGKDAGIVERKLVEKYGIGWKSIVEKVKSISMNN